MSTVCGTKMGKFLPKYLVRPRPPLLKKKKKKELFLIRGFENDSYK